MNFYIVCRNHIGRNSLAVQLACAVIFTSLPVISIAQLSAPNVQNVYGGRINAIKVVTTGTSSSRVFITTESANTAFYADVTHSVGTASVGTFHVIPDLNSSANYGSGVQVVEADAVSGRFFWYQQSGSPSGLLSCLTTTTGTVVTVTSGNISSILIKNSRMFFVRNGSELHFGSLSTTGSYSEGSGSPLSLASVTNPSLQLNSVNNKIYLLSNSGTSSPGIFRSSVAYDVFSSTTAFSTVPTTSLSVSNSWYAFGISPSGRLAIAGADGSSNKKFAYSDDESTWATISMGITSSNGPNISFGGTSGSYSVYYASSYSANKGLTWQSFGSGGFETHPNDGSTACDPINNNVCYMTTDQGIGVSTTAGVKIAEIDNGIEAVQVNDFDMEITKNIAWIASKAGVRKVTNYQTTPIWSSAIFPSTDGSPYYSVAMDKSSTTGSIAYAGNVRVYKTTNDGSSWTQVFTAENAPYNYSSIGYYVSSIEIDPNNSNRVFAGYYGQSNFGVGKGGLFVTENGGTSWTQIQIHSTGADVNVNDIVITTEAGVTVAYVGVEYSTTGGYSIYRVVQNTSGTWIASQNMTSGNTTTGTLIVVTIRDLVVATNGTIYACGTDAGSNHPTVYYKPVGGLWTVPTFTGFPFSSSAEGRTVSFGKDTIYVAVQNVIYYLPVGASSWTTGYTYPVGTQINVLYFDDLLVGTGTGLYAQTGGGTSGGSTGMMGLSANVFLQGAYSSGSTMNNGSVYVPLTQPYNFSPFNYAGTESVFSMSSNIVDWVLVELRQSISPSVSFAKRAALLKNDGSIVDLDGSSAIQIPVATVPSGNYFLVVKHRNHIPIMSSLPITLASGTTATYSLSASQSQVSGTNPLQLLSGGMYGMIAGDTSPDGIVNASDRVAARTASGMTGYNTADASLDGIVNSIDRVFTINNRFNVTQVP